MSNAFGPINVTRTVAAPIAWNSSSITIPNASHYTLRAPVELHENYTFKLPLNKLPSKIYINGGLKTVGIFGSAAEVMYLGKNKICLNKKAFSPTLALLTEITISLEYGSVIYHYCAKVEILYDDCTEIVATLLSKQAM